jgi:hypothetical protein
VNLEPLLALARGLPAIVGHEVPSQVSKAGPTWAPQPGGRVRLLIDWLAQRLARPAPR